MRWLVEVSSLGKTDAQKYCVEAESWQRALQAARSQRGEEGPMSGFSIELLEEGYRAVDPLARVRFIVKRAPDDMPVTVTAPKKESKAPGKNVVAPSQPPVVDAAPTDPKMTPPPASSSNAVAGKAGKKSVPPRPGLSVNAAALLNAIGGGTPSVAPAATGNGGGAGAGNAEQTLEQTPEAKKKAQTMTFGNDGAAGKPAAVERPAPAAPPIGSGIPGLPPVKLLTSREQNPTSESPLTYREYAFAVPAGTSDETAADVLRAQLRLVEAHLGAVKQGKLVNLAAFDVEFKGKPPKPPLATLTWKDWKGDPVLAFPRRSGQESRPPRPPSKPPPSMDFTPPPAPAVAAVAAVAASPTPAVVASAPAPIPVPVPVPVPVPAPAAVAAAPAQAAQAAFPPPAPATAPLPNPHAQRGSAPIPQAPPTPIMTDAQPGPGGQAGQNMVRTPSGRFVRGRIVGDELITALFESMHDLHFLRDALDGGQFCLALATEVLPSRAALIHFFDIEKREWVVACTRGKEAYRLLNVRTPENDELLRAAARRRRAMVYPEATDYTTAARYQTLGGGRSLIVAPVMQAGRALGAIEIINPLDGMPFTEDEGNAMTYIAEQYAEYLGSRGIVLDRARIDAAAAAR